MNRISFFAKPPFELRHLQRVSSIIRGEQIAAHMYDARLNPTSGYENDVCIYVKPHVKPGDDFNFEGHPYLDMVDGFQLWHLLRKRPEIPAIVDSDHSAETMSHYIKNKIIIIPHHHINFERVKRDRGNTVRNVGMIGSEYAFQYIPDEIKQGLANRRLKLVTHSVMFPRMTVTKFYSKMDVMLVWSPYNSIETPALYNPFKMVNASAFGIPTIALDKPAFHEMKDTYFPVHNVEEFFKALDNLRSDQGLYQNMSEICLEKAEKYHIENIAKSYRELT